MGGGIWLHCCGSVLLLYGALLSAALADGRQEFDWPAQPLGEALSKYSAMTGTAVLFDSNLVAGLHAQALTGRFIDDEALARLLAGTGLTAHYSGKRAFTLRRLAGSEPDSPAQAESLAVSTRRYTRWVKHSLWQALCAASLTGPGSYRAAIQLQIDPQGRVARSRLLASTGDPERDAALHETMAALQIALAPPPSMAQPITLLLTPTKDGGQAEACEGVD